MLFRSGVVPVRRRGLHRGRYQGHGGVDRYGGRQFGKAVAFTIGRHSHPKARPEHPDHPAEPSGIDYLRLLEATHTQRLESRINYTALLGHPATNASPSDAVETGIAADDAEDTGASGGGT